MLLYRNIALFLSVLISACSSTDDAAQGIELADLVGLWNSSENVEGKTDVIYTRITSTGEIVEYDYDGDEADQGLDCYQINSGSAKPLNANRFQVTSDLHGNKKFVVELELLDAGQVLKINFPDSDDVDGDGDVNEIIKSQTWQREYEVTVPYNEPVCKQ